MSNFKTDVWVSFNYGGYGLVFSKIFNLPFAPFHNLVLHDDNEEEENGIELVTNDYCKTTIIYDAKEQAFSVDVRNVWRRPITDEAIDYTLNLFTKTGWERQDSTNIPSLKELMNRQHEKAQ